MLTSSSVINYFMFIITQYMYAKMTRRVRQCIAEENDGLSTDRDWLLRLVDLIQ